jgi:hypothetical protein
MEVARHLVEVDAGFTLAVIRNVNRYRRSSIRLSMSSHQSDIGSTEVEGWNGRRGWIRCRLPPCMKSPFVGVDLGYKGCLLRRVTVRKSVKEGLLFLMIASFDYHAERD